MPQNITSETFEEQVLNSKGVVIVDFWADWCAPCKALAPILEKVAEKHEDSVKIAKLNVDENQDIAMRYQITGIPTVKFFKDGKEVETIIGLQTQGVYEELISKYA